MKHSLALILVLLLSACSFLQPSEQDETKGWSAQKLYSEAKSEMDSGDYTKAISYFEKLEARYPYGRYAQQSQLEIAYAYYKDREAASAVAAADRFIKLHPNHPNVDYAYYLKGLANFNENLGYLGYLTNQDLSDRDPKAARESFEAFKELSTRFPDSKYTPDAIARMKYLVNALAGNEVKVAQYYYRRGAYVAAVNRAQLVVEQYPQTPAVEDALAVMVKSYEAMGMTALKEDSLRVLNKNFPNSKALSMTRKKTGSWWQFWE